MYTHKQVQCSWQSPVDTNGLNPEDQKRISQIGLNAWLNEITGVKAPKDLSKALAEALQKTKVSQPLVKVVPTLRSSLAKPTQANKVKPTSVGYPLAMWFFQTARANKDCVSFDQCKQKCPACWTDPVAWARHMGAEIKTEKTNQLYKVIKYV